MARDGPYCWSCAASAVPVQCHRPGAEIGDRARAELTSRTARGGARSTGKRRQVQAARMDGHRWRVEKPRETLRRQQVQHTLRCASPPRVLMLPSQDVQAPRAHRCASPPTVMLIRSQALALLAFLLCRAVLAALGPREVHSMHINLTRQTAGDGCCRCVFLFSAQGARGLRSAGRGHT